MGLAVALVRVVLENEGTRLLTSVRNLSARRERATNPPRAHLSLQALSFRETGGGQHVVAVAGVLDEPEPVAQRPDGVPAPLVQQAGELALLPRGRLQSALRFRPRCRRHRSLDDLATHMRPRVRKHPTQDVREVPGDRRAVLVAHEVTFADRSWFRARADRHLLDAPLVGNTLDHGPVVTASLLGIGAKLKRSSRRGRSLAALSMQPSSRSPLPLVVHCDTPSGSGPHCRVCLDATAPSPSRPSTGSTRHSSRTALFVRVESRASARTILAVLDDLRTVRSDPFDDRRGSARRIATPKPSGLPVLVRDALGPAKLLARDIDHVAVGVLKPPVVVAAALEERRP